MSLFKEPFDESIAKQLEKRQELIGNQNRTPKDIAYLNAKTAWVRLRSSVDFINEGSESPPEMARWYTLLGGINNGNITQTIGNNSTFGAYDIYSNEPGFDVGNNILGLRPMPGITNISIQSKGAYGSLRQATVNFQCWDIKQLNVLEALYMRPGYTVLLDWGWAPFINNDGDLDNSLYDRDGSIFFEKKDINVQDYLQELRNVALIYEGNYDAMFGYIKNYSWKLRNDGGYDCMTEIISAGEMLESFKINHSGPATAGPSSATSTGILLSTIAYDKEEQIRKEYRRNALAGLLAETYALILDNDDSDGSGILEYNALNGKKGTLYYAKKEIELEADGFFSTDSEANEGRKSLEDYVTDDDSNIFITLRSFVELLNNFILIENPDSSEEEKNIIKISVDDRPSSIHAGQPLHCLYNPLQISVDPRVCIIKNDLFEPLIQGINIVEEDVEEVEEIQTISPKETADQFDPIIKQLKDIRDRDGSMEEFKRVLAQINTKEKLAGISDYYYNKYNQTFYDFITGDDGKSSSLNEFSAPEVFSGLGITQDDVFYFENDFVRALSKATETLLPAKKAAQVFEAFTSVTPEDRKKRAIESAKEKTAEQKETLDEIKDRINSSEEGYLSFLNKLSQAYHTNDASIKYGVHGNIFLNLRMLYNLAGSSELEDQDPSEVQTISLMSYLKDVLTMVQNSIGNVNNFEVIIDGNVGYISDVNYVPLDEDIEVFTFAINDAKSIIRDLSLESQIFSDQSTIIAVAAQNNAGKLGLENSTMVAYNQGIKDRNISRKEPLINSTKTFENELEGFILALDDLSELFDSLDKMWGIFDSELLVDRVNKYKKSLTDIIVFFTSYFKTPNKYKAILPTKLSLTMDGIGGLIIGNIFDIDNKFVPASYQGDGIGTVLNYLVTNIKHDVGNNNQWVTTIEGSPFIPDAVADNDPSSPIDINITIFKRYGDGTFTVTPGTPPPDPDTPGGRDEEDWMSISIEYTLGSFDRVGTRDCNKATWGIARNFSRLKKGNTILIKGIPSGESGGNAASVGALKGYENLGYVTTKVGSGYTREDMERILSNRTNWKYGDVASYISSDGKRFHAQIYTNGMRWNGSKFARSSDGSLWVSDDATNYKRKGGTGNFVYYNGKKNPQNSYTLYLSRLP
jgi:hypothetical protein